MDRDVFLQALLPPTCCPSSTKETRAHDEFPNKGNASAVPSRGEGAGGQTVLLFEGICTFKLKCDDMEGGQDESRRSMLFFSPARDRHGQECSEMHLRLMGSSGGVLRGICDGRNIKIPLGGRVEKLDDASAKRYGVPAFCLHLRYGVVMYVYPLKEVGLEEGRAMIQRLSATIAELCRAAELQQKLTHINMCGSQHQKPTSASQQNRHEPTEPHNNKRKLTDADASFSKRLRVEGGDEAVDGGKLVEDGREWLGRGGAAEARWKRLLDAMTGLASIIASSGEAGARARQAGQADAESLYVDSMLTDIGRRVVEQRVACAENADCLERTHSALVKCRGRLREEIVHRARLREDTARMHGRRDGDVRVIEDGGVSVVGDGDVRVVGDMRVVEGLVQGRAAVRKGGLALLLDNVWMT